MSHKTYLIPSAKTDPGKTSRVLSRQTPQATFSCFGLSQEPHNGKSSAQLPCRQTKTTVTPRPQPNDSTSNTFMQMLDRLGNNPKSAPYLQKCSTITSDSKTLKCIKNVVMAFPTVADPKNNTRAIKKAVETCSKPPYTTSLRKRASCIQQQVLN